MASVVQRSLCDYMAEVGSMEDRLVEVNLLYIWMVDIW
jgi:hypothetical protein